MSRKDAHAFASTLCVEPYRMKAKDRSACQPEKCRRGRNHRHFATSPAQVHSTAQIQIRLKAKTACPTRRFRQP